MDILPRNLTDRARKVFALADEEAERLHHGYLGTEHVFLGLLKEGSGVAANVLKNRDIDLRKIGMEIERLFAAGPKAVTMSRRPQTPAVKRLIEYAMEEAHGLKHTWIGTEHILLGLAREPKWAAGQVLNNLGVTVEGIRAEILALLGPAIPDQPKL